MAETLINCQVIGKDWCPPRLNGKCAECSYLAELIRRTVRRVSKRWPNRVVCGEYKVCNQGEGRHISGYRITQFMLDGESADFGQIENGILSGTLGEFFEIKDALTLNVEDKPEEKTPKN